MFKITYRIILEENLFEQSSSIPFLPRRKDIITYPHKNGTLRFEVDLVCYEDDGSNIRVGLRPSDSTKENFSEKEMIEIIKHNEFSLKN